MKHLTLILRFVLVTWLLLAQAHFVFSQAPTTQASQISFSGSGGSKTVNWSNGNGARRLVVAYSCPIDGSCINNVITPANGVQYTASTTFGSGNTVPSSICTAYAVYDGTGSSVSVSGLGNSNTYVFQVFEYNGTGATSSYNTQMSSFMSSSGSNPNSVNTSASNSDQCPQVSQVGFSSCSFSGSTYSLGFGFSITGTMKGVLVVGSTTVPHPSGLAMNSAPRYCGDLSYGGGPALSTNNDYVLYEYSTGGGSGGACPQSNQAGTVTDLSPNTLYYIQAFAWNGTSCCPVYNVAPGYQNYNTFYTGPGTSSSNIIFSGVTSSQISLSWTNGDGASRIVIADTSPISTLPSNNSTYTANSTYGSGSAIGSGYVVYNGSGNSTTVTGLSASTTYYFRIFEYNNSGAQLGNIYLTTTATGNPGSAITIPTAPVSNAASSIGQTSFSANWSASTGATGYYLDVSTANTFSSFVTGYNNLNVGNVTSYSVNTNLSGGTTYYYRVRASNSSGSSTNSSTIQLTTIPPNPVASSASSVLLTSFSANWASATSATGYYLDVSTDNFSTFVSGFNNLSLGNVTTASVTGLLAGTTYQYRVRAAGASGISSNSNTISVITISTAPVATAASNIAQSSFTANWNAAIGAASYNLDVATDNGFSSFVSGYNNTSVAGTSTSVTGLNSGTTYYYRVRATNIGGASSNSNTISQITIPANPTASAATSVGQTGFTANWGSVAGASGYFIDISTDDFSSFIFGYFNKSVSGTNEVVSAISPGLTYKYRVRATNAGGTSSNSNTIQQLTISDAPSGLFSSSPAATSFVANWAAATGASDYRLDVSTSASFSGGFVSGFNDLVVSGTSTTVTGLSANTTYYFRVRSVNSSGTSPSSSSGSLLTLTDAPVASAATGVGVTSFSANWGAVTGASSYKIDVATDAAFSSILSSYNDLGISGTTTSITALSGGLTYYYRVRAVNATGSSANSNVTSALTIPAAPIAIEPTFITTSSFVANWNSTTGAADYRLDVSTDNFSTFLPAYNNTSVSGTSTSVTGLSEGITYKYRVRAVNATGTSASSNTISVVTVPPVPTAQAATSVLPNGFTANWTTVSGATVYLLDVSSDNFSTFLVGYNGKSISATSEILTGLSSNTSYQYRVRATSSSGTSANSGVIQVLTLPAAPVANGVAAADIKQTEFKATWAALAGINEYLLDVSKDNFATYVTGYNALSVTTTSKDVTGLQSGTFYQFRVRAKNATGVSANSGVISVLLLPATPVAVQPSASTVKQTEFTARWNTVTPGVDNYVVEVTDNSGAALTGYPKTVTAPATTLDVTGLSIGSSYKYKVRAQNASGLSDYSNEITQFTIPSVPVLNIVSAPQSDRFIASWQSSNGTVVSYEIEVSLINESDFSSTVLPGYPRSVAAISTIVTVPQSGASYSFRVRATNGGGSSAYSESQIVLLPGGNQTDLGIVITQNSASTFPQGATSVTASCLVTGAFQSSTVKFFYKPISDLSFKEKAAIDLGGGNFKADVTDSDMDELGVEIYFEVKDGANRTKKTGEQKISRTFLAETSKKFITGSFTGTRSSMQIISIPYEISSNTVEAIFGTSLAPGYDKKTWRIAHYQNGRNVEYQTAGFPNFRRGLGFWFNSKVDASHITTGAGNTGNNSQANPFQLELSEGWNQIGNPYPFPIDWSDVLADNPTKTGVSDKLKIYNGTLQNFENSDDLIEFKGAFVHATGPTTLDINVSLKGRYNAGRKKQAEIPQDLAASEWQVPLTITQGQSVTKLSGFGMHPDASLSNDKYDDIRLPRLDEYLDVTFDHPESKFQHFSKDIVPSGEEHSWSFITESTDVINSTFIEWDNSKFGNNDAQLYLLDLTTAVLVDMRGISSYTYSSSERHEFRAYYSREHKDFSPGLLLISKPYPNPSKDKINFNIILPDANKTYRVEIMAYDNFGRLTKRLVNSELPGGAHVVTWNADNVSDNLSSGSYIIRGFINGDLVRQGTQRFLIIH